MNIPLRGRDGSYYIACVKHNGVFVVVGKRLNTDGSLRELGQEFRFDSIEEAKKRCRSLAKMKVRKKGFVQIELDSLPLEAHRHLEIPTEMQLTPEELLALVREARLERYVVFKDVTGMEVYFDEGVEYLALIDESDPDFLIVFDRYGEKRNCRVDRMDLIRETEKAEEAGKIGL